MMAWLVIIGVYCSHGQCKVQDINVVQVPAVTERQMHTACSLSEDCVELRPGVYVFRGPRLARPGET